MGDLYYIWSYEHNAWWKPDRRGYVVDLKGAGKYTKQEAKEILDGANLVDINETAVKINAFFENDL